MKKIFGVITAAIMLATMTAAVNAGERKITYYELKNTHNNWIHLYRNRGDRNPICRIPPNEIFKVTNDGRPWMQGVWVKNDNTPWYNVNHRDKNRRDPNRVCRVNDRKGWVNTNDRHVRAYWKTYYYPYRGECCRWEGSNLSNYGERNIHD